MESTFDKDRALDRCSQIVEPIDLIFAWSRPINSPDDFLLSPENALICDGCVMRLQVIGENVKKIYQQTAGALFSKYLDIPWRTIIALRNIISHEYSNIDEAVIFAIIKQSLLPLRSKVSQIMDMLQ